MQWKIKVADAEYEADSTETVKQWYRDGRIQADSYVYHPVLEKWMYVRELEELRPLVSAPPVPATPAAPSWNPGVAAVLSLVIPGAGQMYKGQVGRGLVWLFSVVFGYFILVVPGLILHLICILNAARGRSSQRSSQGASSTVGRGAASPTNERNPLLLGAAFLFLLWLLGFFAFKVSIGFHLLLVVAIILLVVGLARR